MNFKQTINEIQAEMVNGKIPLNKIFSNGNIAQLPKDSEWRRVLSEIIAAIAKAGLSDDFKKDMDPLDIQGNSLQGKVKIQSDSGKKYTYDINRKKLFKA